MTAKRFTSDYNGDEHLLTHFLNNEKPMTKGEVLNKLNELYEENIQYKRELDNIYLLIGRGDWSGLVDLVMGDVE